MVLPAYGHGSLAEILPSVCANLGVDGAQDVLGLGSGDRWVVLLIDGLGEDLLANHAAHAPFLSGLRSQGRVITAGTPSTTVTSITSLGTGLPPGQHGMAGYSFRIHDREILNALLWDTTTKATTLQPHPTWFIRAEKVGVRTASVTPARFQGTGLTEASLRGAEFCGVHDENNHSLWCRKVVAAATAADRTLVYAYERELDHIGHGAGVASTAWKKVLRRIDQQAARLRAELPPDVRLVITADHGMLDVPGRNFVLLEHEPDLLAGVDSFAGEGRLRHFYSTEPAEVAARWADRMGDHAWVRIREDAIDEGWFGPVDDRVRGHFGDVVVAMRTDWAVMSTTLPRELDLIGMHGSLTPVEMNIPLLQA